MSSAQPVAAVKVALPVTIFLLAVGVWYLWSNGGDTHNTTLPDQVFAELSFNPFSWWQAHDSDGKTYIHHYPDTVTPNVVREQLASERGSLAVTLSPGDELYG